LCGLFFTLSVVLASPAMAQTTQGQPAQSGRGGSSAPAGRGGGSPPQPAASPSAGRGGRFSDPRPGFEQVEARIKKIDEAELKEAPKRDYQIEIGPVQKTKLFRAGPKLLEIMIMAKLVV